LAKRCFSFAFSNIPARTRIFLLDSTKHLLVEEAMVFPSFLRSFLRFIVIFSYRCPCSRDIDMSVEEQRFANRYSRSETMRLLFQPIRRGATSNGNNFHFTRRIHVRNNCKNNSACFVSYLSLFIPPVFSLEADSK
jgi:hypothetical protein